jgi:hypothetical protein
MELLGVTEIAVLEGSRYAASTGQFIDHAREP